MTRYEDVPPEEHRRREVKRRADGRLDGRGWAPPPPENGAILAYELFAAGMWPADVAAELTKAGFKRVTTRNAAMKWIAAGEKLFVESGRDPFDRKMQRAKALRRLEGYLAEILVDQRRGGQKLKPDQAFKIRMQVEDRLAKLLGIDLAHQDLTEAMGAGATPWQGMIEAALNSGNHRERDR